MDQKITSAGTLVSAVLLFFCAFLIGGLGIAFLFAYPDPIWWLGLLMLGSAVLIVMSGISNIKMARRMMKEADEDLKLVRQQLHQTKAVVTHAVSKAETVVAKPEEKQQMTTPSEKNQADTSPIVLAHWKYTPEEWKRFMKWETKERKSNTTMEALIILILGGILLLWKGAGFFLAFLISGIIAVIYRFIKVFITSASIGQGSGKKNEVVITQYAAIINGKYNAFTSEMYWLKDVKIRDEATPPVLQIEFEWQTRHGKTFDEIRVPIPQEKMEEATWLIKVLTAS